MLRILIAMETRKNNLSFVLLKIGWARDHQENFLENLAMLLSAGLDIYGALSAIKTEGRSKIFANLIDFLILQIDNGDPLWLALEKSQIFSVQAISLIKNGEKSGHLSENLKVLVAQRRKEREFYSKIKSALLYPLFVMGLAIIVALGTSWLVLPKLATVFRSLDVKLPAITKALIDFGVFMSHYGYIVVPGVIIILIVIFVVLFVLAKTKFIGQFFLLHAPGIRRLIMEAEIARSTYILGTLLSSGLPIVNSMESLIDSADIYVYRRFYKMIGRRLEEGDSFKKIFTSDSRLSRFWPASIQQLIMAAETSGSLPEMLVRISQAYSEKVDVTSKNLAVLFEPVLLIIVWLGVLGVAVAIFLPIYSLVGSFNP